MGDQPDKKDSKPASPEGASELDPPWIVRVDGKIYIDVLAMEQTTNAPNWLSQVPKKDKPSDD